MIPRVSTGRIAGSTARIAHTSRRLGGAPLLLRSAEAQGAFREGDRFCPGAKSRPQAKQLAASQRAGASGAVRTGAGRRPKRGSVLFPPPVAPSTLVAARARLVLRRFPAGPPIFRPCGILPLPAAKCRIALRNTQSDPWLTRRATPVSDPGGTLCDPLEMPWERPFWPASYRP